MEDNKENVEANSKQLGVKEEKIGSTMAEELFSQKTDKIKNQITPQIDKNKVKNDEITKSNDMQKTDVSDKTIDTKNIEEDERFLALKKDLEKANSLLEENKRYGRQSSQRLKEASKYIKELQENGLLDEEEIERFTNILNLTTKQNEDDTPDVYKLHPIGELLKIADGELTNLRKYTDDKTLDEKIESFNYYLKNVPNAAEYLQNELSEFKEEPLKLLKKMLEIGQQHLDDGYSEIRKVDNLPSYIKKINQEKEKLQKTIDTLKEELAKYKSEQYIDSSYKINSVNDYENNESLSKIERPKGMIQSVLDEERANRMKRRNK
jgi:hypothetical protein